VLHPPGEIYGPDESYRRDMRPGGVPAAPPLQGRRAGEIGDYTSL
jgi:hypothetical protein